MAPTELLLYFWNCQAVEYFYTSRYNKKGGSRKDKVKPTREEQKKVNTRAAERKLRLLIDANYGYGDYHLILDYIRVKGKLLNDLSENNGFQISARNERVEELIKVLDNLGADYEMDMNENDSDVDEDDMYVEMDTEAALIITSTGDKKVQLIKLIREYTGSDLREAKECIDEIEAGNGFFIKGSLEVLEEMKQELDAIGATSKMKYRDKQEQGGCYCDNCGAELASGTKFCPKCGTKVEEAQKMFCPQCGNEIMPGAKFCTKCGARCM